MIMKRNILFLAVSAALLTSSCSDFLDVQPEGNAAINAYFLNDQQAIDAVDGLYERFHQEALYGRELFWEQGAACDVVWGVPVTIQIWLSLQMMLQVPLR